MKLIKRNKGRKRDRRNIKRQIFACCQKKEDEEGEESYLQDHFGILKKLLKIFAKHKRKNLKMSIILPLSSYSLVA